MGDMGSGRVGEEIARDRGHFSARIAEIRAEFARDREASSTVEPIGEEEMERRRRVMLELMAETERLGLYR